MDVHTIEELGSVRTLSQEELAAVTGGEVRNSNGATFYNSDAFRNGAAQFAGVAGGLALTGIAIATAPISFPLALGAAAVSGAIAGLVAADAHIDIQNAKPDTAAEDAAAGSAAMNAAAHAHHNQQVTDAGHAGAARGTPSPNSPGGQPSISHDAGGGGYR
jgi:hypothetical protein